MLTITLVWFIVGLMVIYRIGIMDIIASIQMEAMAADAPEEINNPIYFAITMFIITLFWPLIWIEYLKTQD